MGFAVISQHSPCDSSGKIKLSQNKMQFKRPWGHPDLRPKDRESQAARRWSSRKWSFLRTTLHHDWGHIINNMRKDFWKYFCCVLICFTSCGRQALEATCRFEFPLCFFFFCFSFMISKCVKKDG